MDRQKRLVCSARLARAAGAKTPTNRLSRYVAGVGLALLMGCSEFPEAVVNTFELGVAVPWPDTLAVSDEADLWLTVRTVDGDVASGVDLQWELSDSTLLRIVEVETGPASATALGEGSVEVVVRVDHPGGASADLRHTFETVPLRIDPVAGSWPSAMTVTDSDTVMVAVFRADGDSVPLPQIQWFSSDPEVLGVTELPASDTDTTPTLSNVANRTAVITARRSGSAEIVVEAILDGLQSRAVRVPVTVGGLTVNPGPGGWPDTIAVSDTLTIELDIRDTVGNAIQGLDVQWQSTDTDVLTVASTNTDSTILVARQSDSVEVVALIDPTGFQPQEVRIPIEVTPLVVAFEAWPNLRGAVDTNFMVATETVFLDVRITNRGVDVQRSLPIRWESSNPSLTVEQLTPGTGTRARIVAEDWGEAEIRVIVGGQGEIEEVADTIPVHVLERWIDISTGGSQTCAINWRNEAHCWGDMQTDDQLSLGIGAGGPGGSLRPLRVAGNVPFAKVECGAVHACAIVFTTVEREPDTPFQGPLYCWGDNTWGALGTGRFDPAYVPTVVLGGYLTLNVALGSETTCSVNLIYSDGTLDLHCWGRGRHAGTGAAPGVPCRAEHCFVEPEPVDFGYSPLLAAGGVHGCSPGGLNELACWGDSLYNGSGTGSTDTPTPVAGGHEFVAVDAGDRHTCGITAVDSLAYCWGFNESGRLGSVSPDDSAIPVRVQDPASGPVKWRHISAGGAHTCGISTQGIAYCWGWKTGLGSETETGAPLPTPISVTDILGDTTFADISAGIVGNIYFIDFHSCAITTRGIAYCWGSNEYGKLGTGESFWATSLVPVRVANPIRGASPR